MDGEVKIIDERYRVIEQIGSGAASDVYKAEHKLLGEIVALKVLKKEQLDNKTAVERFQQEAKLAMRLSHPSIATVKGYGKTPDGEPFIVMEYLQGETLEAALARQAGHALPPEVCIEMGKQIAGALAHAHSLSVVHRDIKPSNILLQAAERDTANGTNSNTLVRILDFGVAKDLSIDKNQACLTKTTMMVGTPAYMSPEQCMGQTLGTASDIYSTGVVLFECFTGRKLFDAESDMGVMNMHVNEPVRFQSKDQISDQVREILLRCLAKKPEERYRSADELENALASIKRVRKAAKKKLATASAIVATIVSTGALAAYIQYNGSRTAKTNAPKREPVSIDPTIDIEHKVHTSRSEDPEYLMRKAKEAKSFDKPYWPQIIDDLEQSRKVALKQGRKGFAGLALKELGDVYVLLKKDKLAVEKYNLAISSLQKKEEKVLLMVVYQGLGSTYQRLGDFQKALHNHKLALENAPKYDIYGRCVNRRLCCTDLIMTKNYKDAAPYARGNLSEISQVRLEISKESAPLSTKALTQRKLRSNLRHFGEQIERREEERRKALELLCEKAFASQHLVEIGYQLKDKRLKEEGFKTLLEEQTLSEGFLASIVAAYKLAIEFNDYEQAEQLSEITLKKIETQQNDEAFWKQYAQTLHVLQQQPRSMRKNAESSPQTKQSVHN